MHILFVRNAFTFVPLKNIDAVKRSHIVDAAWEAAFAANGRSAAYVFCGEAADKASQFHARMFAPHLGVREDPATGSAAAAFRRSTRHDPRRGDQFPTLAATVRRTVTRSSDCD